MNYWRIIVINIIQLFDEQQLVLRLWGLIRVPYSRIQISDLRLLLRGVVEFQKLIISLLPRLTNISSHPQAWSTKNPKLRDLVMHVFFSDGKLSGF